MAGSLVKQQNVGLPWEIDCKGGGESPAQAPVP